ncbi:MAG: biopolymer transport protein ExbB [Pseudomonadota bacterium]|nr:biopolymer transport protein ExbB [Pseudomonadota bacterium]
MFKRILAFALFLLPLTVHAWWQEEWPYRVKVTLDAQQISQLGTQSLTDAPLLLRLHTGNFSDFFYLKEDASDLRFIAADDKTPLSYHVEKFDLVNQMLYVWIKLPKVAATDGVNSFYMYYGNAEAPGGMDVTAAYDPQRIAVLHFAEQNNVVVDSSSYQQKAELVNVEHTAALIGNGLKFNGKGAVRITHAPSLQYLPGKGFAFSAWIKPQGAQQDSLLFLQKSSAGELVLAVRENRLLARWQNLEVVASMPLTADAWQHVALNIDAQRMAIFVNGIEVASQAVAVPAFNAEETLIGGRIDAQGFAGDMDEVDLSAASRMAEWFVFQSGTQGQQSNWTAMDQSEQLGSSGGSDTQYFTVIMKNVTLDGWVVMGFLTIMAVISWMVMAAKAMMIKRVRKDNRDFIMAFHELPVNSTAALDAANDAEEYADSPFLNSMFGKHDHFQSSPLYQLYHQGVHELKLRVGTSVSASANNSLTPQAVSAIRATLDASLVRESQKLNNNMVLLTIAIAGGPFLGLLGTVLGVMITFAAIAASGDVNINAIAPGISAALMATVAGLVVAIPALFGYNYLTVRVKELQADMHVFCDEFITRIAEYHS